MLTKLSYANVMATAAVFIALGGTSYAAITVTGKNVRNNSLTSADVKDRSLLNRDFRPGQLPAGRPGPIGPIGPQGIPGPAGATKVRVRTQSCAGIHCSVYCEAGEVATGGGYYSGSAAVYPFDDRPIDTGSDGIPDGWFVYLPAAGPTYSVQVICASP